MTQWSDRKFLTVLTIGGILAIVVLAAVTIGVSAVFDAAECTALADRTGHPTQFAFFGGGRNSCLIEIDGQWIPTSNWLVNSGN